ncbi:restriction endonuclease [Daejeonella oryzae]|uniref:restriction endonuclease n=1 Tax=Daejeonella oryzae TaxID=1122943 RepID=UPI0004158FAB|nr:restriction endonuclease [Daejeonella oryzae]
MKSSDLIITKASGLKVTFSTEKFKRSLINAGADEEQAQLILNELKPKLYEGISTKKIYRIAHNLLRERSGHLAAKYHLKGAIMELGPSGYPFEKFIGEILKHQGYSIKLGEIVKGKCVYHEIDVIAEKEDHYFMIECKYHNQPGIVCDVKIPLYIQSRFKDVEQKWIQIPGHAHKIHQGWVVTNTRFTHDAIQYGICAGLQMLGWDYPKKNSLKDQIDMLELYPITCLTTLSKFEKQQLLDKNIVLCKEICDREYYLSDIGIKPSRIPLILEEGHQLCHN